MATTWDRYECRDSIFFPLSFFHFLTQGRRKSNHRPPFLEPVSDSQYHRRTPTFCSGFPLFFFFFGVRAVYSSTTNYYQSAPICVEHNSIALQMAFSFSFFLLIWHFAVVTRTGEKNTYIYFVIGVNCQAKLFFSSASPSAYILVHLVATE